MSVMAPPDHRTGSRLVDALRAELTKLLTSPGTFWLLAGSVVSAVAVGWLVDSTYRCPPGVCAIDATKLSLSGVLLGQVVVAVFAVLLIGNEYSTGLVHLTFAAMPRRSSVLFAKTVLLAGLVLAAGLVGVFGSLWLGRVVLPHNGFAVPPLDSEPVLRASFGSVLYLALIALLSLGVATVVRNSAAAIGVVLGLLFLMPLFAPVIADPDWRRHVLQAGPMSAGLGIQATRDLSSLPLGPWAGLAVVAGWALGSLLLGGLLLARRDA